MAKYARIIAEKSFIDISEYFVVFKYQLNRVNTSAAYHCIIQCDYVQLVEMLQYIDISSYRNILGNDTVSIHI